MKHLDLFSGIGGFALAAQSVWPEVEHIFCDNDPFSQAVLRKHWPDARIYGDIRELRGSNIGTVDIVTGGFPCQPFSAAGKRRGTEDDRHLWPEMLRVIREVSPTWVIGENVGGLLTWDRGMVLDQVLSDLEDAGYEAWPFVIPACAINAPHRRDRVWIIAHRNSVHSERWGVTRNVAQEKEGGQGKSGERKRHGHAADDRCSDVTHARRVKARNSERGGNEEGSSKEPRRSPSTHAANTTRRRREGRDVSIRQRRSLKAPANPDRGSKNATHTAGTGLERREREKRARQRRLSNRIRHTQGRDQWEENWPSVAARLCTMDDGLPAGLVRPRGWRNVALKAAGNAIVPQVAAQIMAAIKTL